MLVTNQIENFETKETGRKAVVRLAAAWVLLPTFFLVAGGSLQWWPAWIYCAAFLVPMTFFIFYMLGRNPAFIARRMNSFEKEKVQRRILNFGYPLMVATFLVSALDQRFLWSKISNATIIFALALCFLSYLFVLRVFIENPWAARTIETFKNQKVIATGPYALVRHPMYLGTIVLLLATPAALGSLWAFVPALPLIPIFVARILHEEKLLTRELNGYAEYKIQVPYRLVPGIW